MRGSATQYEPITLPGCEDMAATDSGARRAVHPAAAIFPMMSDAELDELAADIKANGQVHPIVCDADGQLIDGRNRLAACEIAGVEPRFEVLPTGANPSAYILSSNVARRHLNKGQAAMAIARIRKLETNFLTQNEAADITGASHTRIAQADMVIKHAPDLIDAVLSGAKPLDVAYATARENKAGASSIEMRMAQLRADASDLADQVVEERLTLDEALAALKVRQRDEHQQRKTSTRLLMDALGLLDTGAKTASQWADDLVPWIDDEFFAPGEVLSAERVERASAALAAVAAQLSER